MNCPMCGNQNVVQECPACGEILEDTSSLVPKTTGVLILDFAFASVFAVAFVTSEFDLAIFVFIFWLIRLFLILRRKEKRHSGKVITARLVIHILVMASITTVAARAPGKRIEKVLEKPVQLQKRNMTLSELEQYCDMHGKGRFPLRVYITRNDDSPNDLVHFPAKRLSLRAFIDAIESQTRMRHRFAGCGNAFTVLKGPAYNFGLTITDPNYRAAPFD